MTASPTPHAGLTNTCTLRVCVCVYVYVCVCVCVSQHLPPRILANTPATLQACVCVYICVCVCVCAHSPAGSMELVPKVGLNLFHFIFTIYVCISLHFHYVCMYFISFSPCMYVFHFIFTMYVCISFYFHYGSAHSRTKLTCLTLSL